MYDLFDLVSPVLLLERGASYLHASTCTRGDAGVALVAWGGVGKTASVLILVTRDGWHYLSDDLGLVDRDGRLWPTPRKLQIYAYNVAGHRELAQLLLQGRGPIDRLNWHWRRMRFGPAKVRRRVSATELFGEGSVGEQATLQKVIFLERAGVDTMQWSTIDETDLAHRASTILIDELSSLFELAVAAESHGLQVGIPPLEKLRADSRAVLNEAFSGQEVQKLRIPVGADPSMLREALRDNLPG